MYISSIHYNKEGLTKVAVCIYHHSIITRRDKEKFRYGYIITSLTGKDKEKLQHVYIITSLQQGGIKKSCGMYISSLHYNKEG